MPIITTTLECPIHDSFRVQQAAGLFDVPLAERARESFAVEVPGSDEPWEIGLIVGPSGSGKTSIARAAFAEHWFAGCQWPPDRAVIDCFGELDIRQLTGLLTAVGFSSPPAWIKPYHVLSGGERFRCDLARALSVGLNVQSESLPLVACDEFTSVVDRQVAQFASAAIAKAIRGGALRCRFVAVTCHYDVAEWLEPDWVVDMATATCRRGRLRRPTIELELRRCHRRAWAAFKRHHYLSGSLCETARCYAALWRGEPVAFCAVVPLIGRRGRWRITRLVTLPDYQGLGIGLCVAEAVAGLYRRERLRMNITASHPAVVAHCRRSSRWRTVGAKKTGSPRARGFTGNYRGSAGRSVVSFEYVGETA